MALFEVPGWSMPAEARPGSPSNPKKRKRPGASSNDEKIQSVAVNMEKLLKKLESGNMKSDSPPTKRKDKKARTGHQTEVEEGKQRGSKSTTSPAPAEGASEKGKRKKKEKKEKASAIVKAPGSSYDDGEENFSAVGTGPEAERDSTHASQTAGNSTKSSNSELPYKSNKKDRKSGKTSTVSQNDGKTASDTKLTALQSKMRQTLDGARFRWINETLYKSSSKDAERLMRDDPKIFEDYHAGFRHQVTSWPTNPVDHFTDVLASSCAERSVIVDLGCGDAALARQLIPKGFTVLSYDLVSTNPFVIAADMCEKLPLPGAEDNDVADSIASQVVDVVVCSLSLMSTNWLHSIREARRVLKQGGELKIAEVTSRFTDVESFVSVISSVGFKLVSKDERNTHFTLFDFRKVKRKHIDDKQWKSLASRGSVLQACEYKRR